MVGAKERLQLAEHQLGSFEDISEGVAAELVATGSGLAFATPVLFPRMPGVVVAIAVELDGQPSLRPAAVHPPSSDATVGLRQGKPCFAQTLQEQRLEPA